MNKFMPLQSDTEWYSIQKFKSSIQTSSILIADITCVVDYCSDRNEQLPVGTVFIKRDVQ
jgi:hypothetical protein